MRSSFVIENIEEMRSQAGIDDVELREEIRKLKVGDLVRLTLRAAALPLVGQTLTVRITRIRGPEFAGKLAARPTLISLSKLPAGFSIRFATIHIHSVAKRTP
jgi:hypothetical protein